MDTPRKTPRTGEQMTLTPYGEWIVDARFAEQLEIETQKLAEAVDLLLDLSEGTDDFTGWRKAQARRTLAAHKAKQPK